MSKTKAKQVIRKLVENGGNTKGKVGVSTAMRAVGYSPAYARNPKKFTSTKVYKELMKEYIPEEMILSGVNELIRSTEIQHYLFPKMTDEVKVVGGSSKPKKKGRAKVTEKVDLTNDEIREIVESVPGCQLIYVRRDFMGAWAFYQAPDNMSRDKGIEKAIKLRGLYSPERIEITKRKYQDLSNKELAELEKTLVSFLLKK